MQDQEFPTLQVTQWLTSAYGTGASDRSAHVKVPQVLTVLHRGRELHLTGGAPAERSSSDRRGRGDEGAVAGGPGTGLAMS